MISATPCLSAPNYTGKKPVIYDVSYNINLRNKLEADFTKKYYKETPQGYELSAGANTYNYEVETPYALMKKPDNYKILK